MEGLVLESTHARSTEASKTPSIIPFEFRRVGKWTAYNAASVLRVRAGCRYFDMHAPKEDGDKNPLQIEYDVWNGKTYSIDII